MRWVLLLLFMALPAQAPVQAEEVVAGLSQNRIAITANFDGSEILVFGAVKRDAPAPDGQMEVLVTVEGPSEPITVRRKERRFGIWVNTDAVEVDRAPSFYAVATSAPMDEILSDYITRILLTRTGQVVDEYQTEIAVRKVGLERFLFNLAHGQPLVYGLLSLAIAIAAGWLASAVFRYIRL